MRVVRTVHGRQTDGRPSISAARGRPGCHPAPGLRRINPAGLEEAAGSEPVRRRCPQRGTHQMGNYCSHISRTVRRRSALRRTSGRGRGPHSLRMMRWPGEVGAVGSAVLRPVRGPRTAGKRPGRDVRIQLQLQRRLPQATCAPLGLLGQLGDRGVLVDPAEVDHRRQLLGEDHQWVRHRGTVPNIRSSACARGPWPCTQRGRADRLVKLAAGDAGIGPGQRATSPAAPVFPGSSQTDGLTLGRCLLLR